MSLRRQLERIDAPLDLCDWAQAFEGSFDRAWQVCPRADWQIWLAAARQTHTSAIVSAASQCAQQAICSASAQTPELAASMQTIQRIIQRHEPASRQDCEEAAEIAEHVSEHAIDMSLLSAAAAAGWAARAAESLMFAAQIRQKSDYQPESSGWDPIQDALSFSISACAQAAAEAARAISAAANLKNRHELSSGHIQCASLVRRLLDPVSTLH